MGLYTDYSDASFQFPYYTSKQTAFYEDVENILSKDKGSSVKWNTYYYKRYKALNSILYFIMLICVIIIVLTIVKKKMSFFDDTAYSVIVGIILAMSVMYIITQTWGIMFRDNQNFDEYNYTFNTNVTNTNTNTNTNADNKNSMSECVSTTPSPQVNYSSITN
jgi:hypothetical protein